MSDLEVVQSRWKGKVSIWPCRQEYARKQSCVHTSNVCMLIVCIKILLVFLLFFIVKFPLRCFYNHYFLLLNVFLLPNMKKKQFIMSFFLFVTTLDLICPKFCLSDHTHFAFSVISNKKSYWNWIQLILITAAVQ